MIFLKILALWIGIPSLIALARFISVERQEHARIKNASGSSANVDDFLAHVAPRNTTDPEQ